MKKKFVKFVSLICVFVLFFQVMPMAASARSIDDVKGEIDEKMQLLDSLQDSIAANEDNKEAYEAALLEYEQNYEELVLLIDEQEVLIAETEDKLIAATDRLSDANTRIQSNQDLYAQRLRAIYEMNSTNSMLTTLLAVDDYGTYVQIADALGRISQHDTEILEQLSVETAEIQDSALVLQTTIDEMTQEMLSLQENRQWALAKMEEMTGLIASAEFQISQSQEQSAATEAEIAALQAEYAAIFQQLQQQGSQSGDGSVRYGGPLSWPVPGYSTVSSWYGDPRSNTGSHYGVDIPAPDGTPIVSAAPGTVITSQWHYSYGWYVVVDHGGGLRTLYAHCYQQGVPVGSYVNIGDTIALVGNTGQSFGSHLHIEVHDNGSRQDPAGANYLGIY